MQDKRSILQAAMTLSEEDRLDLAESLLASVPEDLIDSTDESWHQELRRRADELETGSITPVTWDAMKQWVREQSAMLEVILHPSAFKEFKKAFRWYRRRSLNAALRFDKEVQASLQRIAKSPDSFPKVEGNCRHLLLKRFRYSIVYRRYREAIHVLAIAHASRKPGYWKRRMDDPSSNGHRGD